MKNANVKDYDEISEYYDKVYLGIIGEVAFYVKEARKAKSVLELACGTGRVTLPIAKKGVEITGIDISAGMLEKARQKALKQKIKGVRFIKADMRTFRLNKKFDLIIIPFNAFLHNLTVDDEKKTLQSIRRHLKRDGRLIFSVFAPDMRKITEYHGKILKTERVDKETGDVLKIYDRPVYDILNQLIEVTVTLEVYGRGRLISNRKNTIKIRYCFRDELLLLFENSGFKVANVYGSFRKQKLTSKSKHMIWVLMQR